MFEINGSTVIELQAAMQRNELTSRKLVLYYLSRIAEIDKCDGGLNSVLELNPDALFIADTLDAMRATGKILGVLHGIPVMLKDNISTGDKMRTSAGSVALQDNFAPYDAHIAKLLREAGAVILGKTNMTEFANYMSSMPNGYSSRGGQTFNPYDKTAEPSGSSTGSAVAVSANLCAGAVGTETHGSIISPSQVNGIVGIKPTLGLLSRHGIIPISFTLDTPGPMTRTVTDAAVLLNVMSGADEKDLATNQSKQIDYTQYFDKDGLKGMRIGINRMYLEDADKEKTAILESLIPIMEKQGVKCVDVPEHSFSFGEKFGVIMQYEFKCGINNYLASLNSQNNVPKTLQEIIVYNQNNPKEALKHGQSTLLNAQNNASGTLTEPEYINAILAREDIINGYDKIFIENEIDILFDLAGTGLPPFTGFPYITIPVGMKKNNLSLGSSWAARRFEEKSLIRFAYALEQTLNARRNPINMV